MTKFMYKRMITNCKLLCSENNKNTLCRIFTSFVHMILFLITMFPVQYRLSTNLLTTEIRLKFIHSNFHWNNNFAHHCLLTISTISGSTNRSSRSYSTFSYFFIPKCCLLALRIYHFSYENDVMIMAYIPSANI